MESSQRAASRQTTPADSPTTTLTLEIDAGAEPIAGSLRDGGGTRRTFAGWLGLLEALDAAVAAKPTAPRV